MEGGGKVGAGGCCEPGGWLGRTRKMTQEIRLRRDWDAGLDAFYCVRWVAVVSGVLGWEASFEPVLRMSGRAAGARGVCQRSESAFELT